MKILPFVLPVLLFLPVSYANPGSFAFAQPKLVKVPGTKASLVPPASLKPTDQFPGFMDDETSSSIVITEIPAPYSEMAAGFTKEALATKGMNLLSKKEISLDGGNYFFMQGWASREEQEKYLAAFTRIAKSFRKK